MHRMDPLRTSLKTIIVVVLFLYTLTGCNQNQAEPFPEISGALKAGFRVVPLAATDKDVRLTVYRGDYIKFRLDPALSDSTLSIPDLAIRQVLPRNFKDAPYFKMKATGTYAFSLGEIKGVLTVIPFQEKRYHELSAREAMDLIRTHHPLVLDVRTPPEYAAGHLPGAKLVPLNQLNARLSELASYKHEKVFIYCATGNRSTVAAKILIDNGFQDISNLRHGIVDWQRQKMPVVRESARNGE